jgi:hypothetical protein
VLFTVYYQLLTALLGVAAIAHEAADLANDFAMTLVYRAVAEPTVGVILWSIQWFKAGGVVGDLSFRPFSRIRFVYFRHLRSSL